MLHPSAYVEPSAPSVYTSHVLAISSGGDHSAFVLGVLDELAKHEEPKYDSLIGISAGALISTCIAQVDIHDTDAYKKQIKILMDTSENFIKPWTRWGPIWNAFCALVWHESFFKTNMESFVKHHCQRDIVRKLQVGAYNRTRGIYETFDQNDEHIIQAVAASAAVPTVFSPIHINGNIYCDGAIAHVLPIIEIKDAWKTCDTLDIMLCYPTVYDEFIKTGDILSHYKLAEMITNTMQETIWQTMQRDIEELAKEFDIPKEEFSKGGTWDIYGRRLRFFVPTEGIYCDFMHRNICTLRKIQQHGAFIANQMLQASEDTPEDTI